MINDPLSRDTCLRLNINYPNIVLEYIFFFYLMSYNLAMHKNVAGGIQLNVLNNLTLSLLQRTKGETGKEENKMNQLYGCIDIL